MKLENCGRCGLGPVELCEKQTYDRTGLHLGASVTHGCPVHDIGEQYGMIPATWNAAQFAARTERINAAAVALMAARSTPAPTGETKWDSTGSRHSAVTTGFESVTRVLEMAERLIDAQDAAARVRWAEMQKGE